MADLLQPGPHHRKPLADEEQAEVPVTERPERAGRASVHGMAFANAGPRHRAATTGLASVSPTAAPSCCLNWSSVVWQTREPRALLLDDLRWCAGDEVLVGELRWKRCQTSASLLRDFLREPLPLGSDVRFRCAA